MPPSNLHSCVACARRKVKCDKLSPCSRCSRTQTACVYRAPVPSQRHRRQLTQGDLLSKIQELETLLNSNGIHFEPLGNQWVHSSWQGKLSNGPHTQPSSGSSDEPEIAAQGGPPAQLGGMPSPNTILGDESEAARLWSGLSEDVRSHLLKPGSLLTSAPVAETSCHLAAQTVKEGRRRPAQTQ